MTEPMMTEDRLREMESDALRHVLALIAEVRRLQQDVAFHADCRPNRKQAEAALADAKATNDRWADAISERDAARAERDVADRTGQENAIAFVKELTRLTAENALLRSLALLTTQARADAWPCPACAATCPHGTGDRWKP